MNQGRIIVITGAPGTGKTTTASVVAKESDLEKSVHMHTDDFYHYLSNRYNYAFNQRYCFSSKRKNSKRYGLTILDNSSLSVG